MIRRKPEGRQRMGWGARVEAAFRPRVHWGAEFLDAKVRLCGLRVGEGRPVWETFEGSPEEAAAFAAKRGLAYEGLHGAVSHLPFKIAALEGQEGGPHDDALLQAEGLRPAGLPAEALDMEGFQHQGARFALMAREDALRGFREHLPSALAELRDLTPSPLAPLPFLDLAQAPERLAALLPDAAHTHVLFLRQGVLEAYVKIFAGLEAAAKDPGGFLRELRKVLIYHYAGRFPDSALDAVQIWRDGPAGELAAALRSMGISQVTPEWKEGLGSADPAFLPAAAAALSGSRSAEPLAPFGIEPARVAAARRLWLGRAGRLARIGTQAVLGIAIIVAVIGLAAAAFGLVVNSKTQAWSGELKKWEALQAKKAQVEAGMAGLQGLLTRRTTSYAALQRIAALLPPEVWVDVWETEAGAGGFTHRLEGYALAEARVPEFLANLEKSGAFQSVKLKSTEKIRGEKVEQKTGISANRKDLIRFQLGMTQ